MLTTGRLITAGFVSATRNNGHGETQNDSDSHIFDIRRTRPAAGSPIYTLAGFTGNEGASVSSAGIPIRLMPSNAAVL